MLLNGTHYAMLNKVVRSTECQNVILTGIICIAMLRMENLDLLQLALFSKMDDQHKMYPSIHANDRQLH